MAIPTAAWSETTPAGTDVVSAGDDRIREMKTQLREIIEIDHVMEDSGNGTTWGYHVAAHFTVQAADPDAVANSIILYGKDVSAKTELHARDEDGNVVQITSGGELNVDFSDYLALAGGTMSGAIAMGASKITGLAAATENGDALRWEHSTAATIDHPDSSVTAAKIADAVITFAKMAAGSGITQLTCGTYTGNGSSTRTITAGVDLSAGTYLVAVARSSGSRRLVIKTNSMSGNYSIVIGDSYREDCIKGGAATGFIIGERDDVNNDGSTFFYFILKAA